MKTKNIIFCMLILLIIPLKSSGQLKDSGVSSANNSMPPHLKITDGIARLIVNNRPFLSVAGEVHNSSSSSVEYMEKIWPKLVQMNLNTVLVPVSWELVEPKEGQFNFDLIDSLIIKARESNLKIIFLWFGSWKNMVSTYVPGWVKSDPDRYSLFCIKNGEKLQMLSAFEKENILADSRAFAALMKHVKQVDAREQTVIMIQVENEVGTQGGGRDYSKLALEAYKNKVPKELILYLQKNNSTLIPEFKKIWASNGFKTSGNWVEIFGEGIACNEIFMAWHLAHYIGEVIKAGKGEYNIPMFVNASVGRQDGKPGTYPSGGPLPFVMDVWRAGAPELDMLCPDIYVSNFAEWCERYTQSGNPLYIPETGGGETGAINALQAFCNFNAIGFSPFGIESRVEDPDNGSIPQIYGIIRQLTPLILTKKGKLQMVAISGRPEKAKDSTILGRYLIDLEFRKSRSSSDENTELSYALLIETGPDEFIAAGKNVNIQFALTKNPGKITGILAAEEGSFENGIWIPGRRLNGDEIMASYDMSNLARKGKSGNGLKFGNKLSLQHVILYSY